MTGEVNAIEGRIHCSRFPRGEPHGGSVRLGQEAEAGEGMVWDTPVFGVSKGMER